MAWGWGMARLARTEYEGAIHAFQRLSAALPDDRSLRRLVEAIQMELDEVRDFIK